MRLVQGPCLVVGSGILGLAVSETLSRHHSPVVVMSNNHPLAASGAAAANLSLKAQQFGRHPHFEWKIKGFHGMEPWLQSLLLEAAFPQEQWQSLFAQGEGVVHFPNTTALEKQWHRTRQNPGELVARALPPQQQRAQGLSIFYGQEAWVHGPGLLALLKKVLRGRGVVFQKGDARGPVLEQWVSQVGPRLVVVCGGAWTPQLLESWGISWTPPGAQRLTGGTTWHWPRPFPHPPHPYCEFFDEGGVRFVVSGGSQDTFLSSTTVKMPSMPLDALAWQESDRVFFHKWKSVGTSPKYQEPGATLHGVRIGFGHSELALDHLGAVGPNHTPLVVCAGAHKSGYLLAPIVGKMVLGLLQ